MEITFINEKIPTSLVVGEFVTWAVGRGWSWDRP
jgi:hypothetical protein